MLKNSGNLPERPGVYLFKSATGKPLYIGKAADLRKRVSQYFRRQDDPLLRRLLERSASLETIVTESESDALLLESDLVHSHLPPFNIRLKDDKSFPFIEITLADEFPGIFYSRRVAAGSFALGPLVDARRARRLIDAVSRLFRLRTCGDALFRKGIPCLYYHIERCSAPCAGKIGLDAYGRQIAGAVELLRGRKGKASARLRGRMRSLAGRLDFEGAQKAKEELEALRGFSLRSYVSRRTRCDRDVIAASLLGHEGYFALFAVSNGRVSRGDYFHLPTLHDSLDEVLKEFLLDYYRLRPLPGEIVVSHLPAQVEELATLLPQLVDRTAPQGRLEGPFAPRRPGPMGPGGRTAPQGQGRRVAIRIARRGEARRLLELAQKNLALFVQKSDFRALGEEMMRELRLRRFPARIEGYDISHLGEKNRVGARVVFQDGQPEKRLYRSYIIRNAAPGDPAALREVLSRRLEHEPSRPDLLLIDGGLPQLGVARQLKKKLGLESDLAALAKNEERVFLEDGSSLVPTRGSLLRHLLQNIRDEVHRRAISHHRKRRGKI